MKPFKHYNALSVEDAVKHAAACSGKSAFMAGGTDLLGVLKSEILPGSPELLINLKTIPGLDRIEDKGSTIQIGSACRLTDIKESGLLEQNLPSLCEAAGKVAFPEIRNMGTIGGNLCQDTRCWYYRYPGRMGGQIPCCRKGEGPCHAVRGDNRYHAVLGGKKCVAVCPSDLAVVLAALEAEILVCGSKGRRSVPVQNFFTITGNILEPGEMVEYIDIPKPSTGARQLFLKNSIRKSIDFATVSVAVRLQIKDGICRDARIILGAVAPVPWRAEKAERAVKGKELTREVIEQASLESVSGARPLSRNGYKIKIVQTLVEQALSI